MFCFGKVKKLKNSLKVMQERNEDLYKRDVKHQEMAQEKFKAYREEIAKLKIELEDVKGFLEQEKAVSNALRKERATLKRKLTMLQKEVSKID